MISVGIPADRPDEVFCDNQLVVDNLSILTSTLNKRKMQFNILGLGGIRWLRIFCWVGLKVS